MSTTRKKSSGFLDIFKAPARATRLSREKARLEAFLAAVPGEYCGWANDGSIAYSQGFSNLIKQPIIKTIADIQSALAPSDAAALEGLFSRLEETGIPFTLNAHSTNKQKTFKINGVRGNALENEDFFHILWLEDITTLAQAEENFRAEHNEREEQLAIFEAILDTVPRPFWLRDDTGKILWVNRMYSRFLNDTPPREIVEQGKELFNTSRKTRLKKPDGQDWPMPGPALATKAREANDVVFTRAHAVLDGERQLMNVSETPLFDLNLTLGIGYNITAEEELERQFARHKSTSRELLEHLRSSIAIFTADQKLEFYNTAFAELWGLEAGWLNTRPKLGEIMEKMRETRRLPEQADFRRFKQSWVAMFTDLIDSFEDLLHLPDGTTVRMLVIPHSMGGLVMNFEDVTSRLALESSYNTLIAVQKETLDNLAESVAVYGGDGRLKLWNPAFGRLWNLNPEDLSGEPHITKIIEKMKSFFTEEEWPTKQEELIASGLDRAMHEGRITRVDESLVDFTTVPLPDGGVLVTYTDVTDTVRVENALREKAAALEAAEQLKLDFLANVSYQLRTPLNAIMGFNDILDQEYFGPLNERQKDYTRDIKRASEHLLELINDILDLSSLEAGYMTLNRQDFKIQHMIDHVMDLVSEWARKRQIEITVKCPKNIGSLHADERRLQQVLINLVRNAINFTPEGGQITLTFKRAKDGIHMHVSDTGVGISKEDHARIFEPFERARNDHKNEAPSRNGAGLGLTLVREIVELHDGKLKLKSEPGKGTNVKLFVPFTAIHTDLKLPVGKTSA